MRNCGCHSHNGLLLSPEGLAQRSYDEQEGVDRAAQLAILGSKVSVSALVEVEDDFEYVPDHHELNHRLIIHHGS